MGNRDDFLEFAREGQVASPTDKLESEGSSKTPEKPKNKEGSPETITDREAQESVERILDEGDVLSTQIKSTAGSAREAGETGIADEAAKLASDETSARKELRGILAGIDQEGVSSRPESAESGGQRLEAAVREAISGIRKRFSKFNNDYQTRTLGKLEPSLGADPARSMLSGMNNEDLKYGLLGEKLTNAIKESNLPPSEVAKIISDSANKGLSKPKSDHFTSMVQIPRDDGKKINLMLKVNEEGDLFID